MFRRPLCALLGSLVGCALSSPSPPAAVPGSAAAPSCRTVDTAIAPTITSLAQGGVVIHTFVAPTSSASTATHVVETAEGLIVVDTQMLRDYARQFRAFVDSLGKPVTHVIISHAHPDHYFGLEFFEDLPTFALPQTRTQMGKRNKFHLTMHRDTQRECDAVTDRVRLVTHDLQPGPQVWAGLPVIVDHVVGAEDNDQVVIRIPAAGTVILQDLMASDAHAFVAGGMIEGWIEALRGYASQTEYTHVLVGHGSPTDRDELTAMIHYLQQSQEIFDTATTGAEFTEAMRAAFPERHGLYIVELMAMMKYPPPTRD